MASPGVQRKDYYVLTYQHENECTSTLYAVDYYVRSQYKMQAVIIGQRTMTVFIDFHRAGSGWIPLPSSFSASGRQSDRLKGEDRR